MDEPRAQQVADLFQKIKKKEIQSLIPATVLSEIMAILSKKKLQETAFQIEEFLCKIGVEIVPVNRDMAVLSAAIQRDASVYTFDSEFSQVTEVPVLGLAK